MTTPLRTLRLSFSLVALALASSTSLLTSSAVANPESDAKEHFKAGVLLLQDPEGARYEDAYREFRAAYVASPNPKILGNIGFCAMKLERDGEAVAAYTRYLAEVADVDPDERDQISRDLLTMNSGLVHLSVEIAASEGAVTVTDTRTPVTGSPVVNTYGPFDKTLELGVRPGRHMLRVRNASGDESKTWEVDAVPGAKTMHLFTIEKVAEVQRPLVGSSFGASAPPPPSRTVPWLVTSLGGAMLVTSAVTGILVMNKVSRLESRCPNDTCPAGSGLEADRDSVKKLMKVTDFFLVGGAVVATTGIVWLLLSRGSSDPEAAPTRTAGLTRPDLGCSGVGCTFSITGRF